MKTLLAASMGGLLLGACSKDAAQVTGDEKSAVEAVKSGDGFMVVNDGGERPLYESLQKHLRLGGDYYSYTYVGDSYEEIAGMVDDWVVTPYLADAMKKDGVDLTAEGVLQWAGLDEVKAMGASSHAIEGGYETRNVFVLDDPNAGIWQMMGAPRPSLAADVFGADVSVAADMQLDLTGVRKWLKELNPMIGEEAAGQLEMMLEQGAGQQTVGEMLDAMNARLAFGMSIHEDQNVVWDLDGLVVNAPDMDLIVCAEGLTKNFDELRTIISSNPQFEKVEFEGGITGYATVDSAPIAMEDVRPVIAYDAATNRIFLASRVSYLEKTLAAAEKLKDSAAYQAAMKGMPADVLSTVYFSKQAGTAIGDLLESTFADHGEMLSSLAADGAAMAAEGQVDVEVDDVQSVVTKLLKLRESYLSQPWVSVTSRDGNAVYTIKRTPLNGRPLVLQDFVELISLNPVTMATLTGTFFTSAQTYRAGSDRATCILNQRNAQVATRAWSNLYDIEIGSPLELSDIVGPGRFLENEPTCPDGGMYTWSPVIPSVGVQCMRCSNPDHKPENTSDW
ncbi:hypothetical protein [Sulfuriroseicoccus oceanibius]|uniref:Uncharacterized protein n=1 Tax=Sulfuriroseicoccus oceanibius TaxID=2707525 RepID=A0A6B3LET7_9BACT|nr:hypothetical protein [Sulfuriroseicoccus oceanibius]QQL44992.1 hypothetical protein G3M56_014195 [Sulfuriroseicoccus oceanibius]